MKYLAVIVSVLFFSISCNACSYTVGTTSGFILYTDLIVTALVEDKKPHPLHPDSVIVYLKVAKILKGQVDSKLLEVYVDTENSCPGPAQYEIGEEVTTFLIRNKQNRLVTNGKFHGLKRFSNPDDRLKFEVLVVDRLEIAKIKSRRKSIKKMIDWSLRHIEQSEFHQITIEEYSHKGFYFIYDKKNKEYKKRRGVRLNPQQKERLIKYLLSKKYLNFTDFMLFPDLAKGREVEVIEYLFQHLQGFDRSKGVWYTEANQMRCIVEVSQRKDLGDLYAKIKLRPLNTNDQELLKLTELFISKVNPISTNQ